MAAIPLCLRQLHVRLLQQVLLFPVLIKSSTTITFCPFAKILPLGSIYRFFSFWSHVNKGKFGN
jgi:hypothetical protein